MTKTFQLLIAGAGGFGREVAAYATEAHAAGLLAAPPVGFLDDGMPEMHGCPLPVVGTIRDHGACDGLRLILAIGDPAARARLAAQLSARGVRFATLVHPRAYVADNAMLGEGCIIAPFASVAPHAELAKHVLANTHAGIGHDCRIGEACTLSPHAVLNGWVRLDREVMLGSGAVVTARINIGARSSIAAGAVVYGDVGEDMLALGNPARCRLNQ